MVSGFGAKASNSQKSKVPCEMPVEHLNIAYENSRETRRKKLDK